MDEQLSLTDGQGILKATATTVVPNRNRATGYGVFWFLGAWLLGVLYDVNITAMVWLSATTQAISIPLYILSSKKESGKGKEKDGPDGTLVQE